MSIFNRLRMTSSRLDKERLLREATREELLAFVYAYHPYKTYGVTSFSIDIANLGSIDSTGFELLDKLVERRLTGNAAYDTVEQYASTHGDLIKLVCKKDLKCGVTATTINKVYPGRIPQFKVQLAKEVPIEKLVFPLIAQTKFDGVRIIMLKQGEHIEFRTRNGKLVYLPKLAKQMQIANIENIILDGEFTFASGKSTDRTTISGMVNSAIHGGAIDEAKITFNVFDAMPIAHFATSYCPLAYRDRYILMLQSIDKLPSWVKPADYYIVESTEEVQALYRQRISEGYEGLILKSTGHKYTFKRSRDWVKMKEIKSTDLYCAGIEEGEGKYEGLIGALICVGEVEGQRVAVKVGSGLTDQDRCRNSSEFFGKTIEVKYNSIIQDSITKEWSLFLPRFTSVRFDK